MGLVSLTIGMQGRLSLTMDKEYILEAPYPPPSAGNKSGRER